MSERELRRVAGHKGTCRHSQTHYMPTPEPCTCGLDEALAKDPDVVDLLRWAYEELKYAGGGGEEAVLMCLIDRLEKQVDLSNEPPGWEWVDATPDPE